MKSTIMSDDEENASMAEIFDTQCNALDIELINLVKDRKALYDLRVPQKDRTKIAKTKLWDEVSRSMQRKLKPLAAEVRWKYLRENYIKARKKQKLKEELAKKTGVPVKTNKYKRKYAYRYYEQMLFLNDALDYQKTVAMKNTTKQKSSPTRKSSSLDEQETMMDSNMSNDAEESTMNNEALLDHQYETIAISIPNNEPDLSVNPATIVVGNRQSSSSLDSTVKSNNESSINYEQLFLNYLQKTTEKPSPVDGFLTRLGEGLKRLPYRERSKLELEFLSRLNEVEDKLGLLD